MDKKGFTVVELIVTVTLTFVIVSLLFQILISLRDVYISSGIKTQLLNKQTMLSSKVNQDLYEKDLSTILKCGRNCLNFIFKDGSTSKLVIDTSNHLFTYGDYSTELVPGSQFRDVDIRVEKIDDIAVYRKNAILIMDVPIVHNLFETRFGFNVLYPFNTLDTAIEDVVFDNYNTSETRVVLKGSSNMEVLYFTEPGWYTVDGSSELIEDDPRVEVLGEVDNDNYGVYQLDYVFTVDGEVIDIKTRSVEIIPST